MPRSFRHSFPALVPRGARKNTTTTYLMKKTLTTLALAGALTLGGVTGACAQDSGALIDALVRKKVLTPQEAENVRADLIQENAASNAGKLQLSNSITSLKLYGDVRLRYQYDNKDPQIETAAALSDLEQKTVNGKKVYVAGNTKVVDPATGKVINGQLKQGTTGKGSPQDGSQRNRERIRLRLGTDFEPRRTLTAPTKPSAIPPPARRVSATTTSTSAARLSAGTPTIG